ncbi:MAG: CRTAC1 family protein [Pirellulales bacterium]
MRYHTHRGRILWTLLAAFGGVLAMTGCGGAPQNGGPGGAGQDAPGGGRPDRASAVRPRDPATSASAGTPAPSDDAARDAEAGALAVRPPSPDDWFVDLTATSGVNFTYHNGQEGEQYTLLETVGGGCALLDFDRDGDLDLFFPGGGTISTSTPPVIGGRSPALYRNDGDWKFVEVTAPAGWSTPPDYTHGATSADFDGDGFCDLFVTAYGRCRLYHNLGDGTWADVSDASGASFVGWSTAAAWGDVDGDGWLDLYVAQYVQWDPAQNPVCQDPRTGRREVCPPQRFAPAADRLFRNRADGTFVEVTAAAELSDQGRGLGVVAADINGDGWLDYYVANDAGPNHLYLGGPQFPLRETALTAGVAFQELGLPEGSMGVDLADYNGDGRADLWVTNFELEDNALYRGEADGLFRHATVAAGLAGVCFAHVGFGTAFDDLDGDGRPDLVVLNGHVFYGGGQSRYRQPAFLFRNRDGQRFENASASGGPYFHLPHAGRGLAVGDLDNDGDLDLVMVQQNEPVVLLSNRRTAASWVRFQLRGVRQHGEAIGARLEVMSGPTRLVRWLRSGAGYLSQFDSRVLVPAEGPVDLVVTWPGGAREQFSSLAPGRTHDIVEGTGQAAPATAR